MWRKAESNTKPVPVLEIKNNRVIVTRNVIEEQSNDGVVIYKYEERIMSDVEYAVQQAVWEKETRRENAIIDEYTLQLIEEGVL